MSSTVGAKFEITAQDKTSAAFQSAHNHLNTLSKNAAGFSKAAGGMGSGITSMFSGLASAAGPLTAVIAGVGALVAIGKEWFDINDKLQKQELKLSNAITNTGRTLGFSAQQAEQYAQYLQNTTTASKEDVMQIETNLASSRAIATSNIKGATLALLDMAAATNKSADTLSTVFTEALANPAKAFTILKTYGVDLNVTQREMIANAIKAGDATNAQAIIIQAVNDSYKNQATTMRNTMGGALEGLKHSFEDLFESSGKTTGGIAKFINQISAVLESPGFKQALKYIGDAFSIAFKVIGTIAKVLMTIDRIIIDEIVIALHDVITWIEKGAKAVYGFLSQFKIFNTIIDAVKTYFLEFVNWIIKEADKVLAYFHKHIDELNAQADKILNTAGFTPPAPAVDESGPTHDTKGTGFIVQKDKIEKQIKAFKLKPIHIHLEVIKTDLKKFKDPIDESQQLVTDAGKKMAGSIQSAMANAFDSIGQKGASLKNTLHDMFASIAKDAANLLSQKAMMAMFGGGGSGTGSGTGASGFASMFATYFGGAHASGGTAPGDKVSLVGESGPELLIPHNSMDVIPNNQLSRMGGTTNHNVNIDARGAGPDETAKLLAMRNDIIATMKGSTELRLQRGNWMKQ